MTLCDDDRAVVYWRWMWFGYTLTPAVLLKVRKNARLLFLLVFVCLPCSLPLSVWAPLKILLTLSHTFQHFVTLDWALFIIPCFFFPTTLRSCKTRCYDRLSIKICVKKRHGREKSTQQTRFSSTAKKQLAFLSLCQGGKIWKFFEIWSFSLHISPVCSGNFFVVRKLWIIDIAL